MSKGWEKTPRLCSKLWVCPTGWAYQECGCQFFIPCALIGVSQQPASWLPSWRMQPEVEVSRKWEWEPRMATYLGKWSTLKMTLITFLIFLLWISRDKLGDKVTYKSVGQVLSISTDGEEVCVEFPNSTWIALKSQLEIVPSVHKQKWGFMYPFSTYYRQTFHCHTVGEIESFLLIYSYAVVLTVSVLFSYKLHTLLTVKQWNTIPLCFIPMLKITRSEQQTCPAIWSEHWMSYPTWYRPVARKRKYAWNVWRHIWLLFCST